MNIEPEYGDIIQHDDSENHVDNDDNAEDNEW